MGKELQELKEGSEALRIRATLKKIPTLKERGHDGIHEFRFKISRHS